MALRIRAERRLTASARGWLDGWRRSGLPGVLVAPTTEELPDTEAGSDPHGEIVGKAERSGQEFGDDVDGRYPVDEGTDSDQYGGENSATAHAARVLSGAGIRTPGWLAHSARSLILYRAVIEPLFDLV